MYYIKHPSRSCTMCFICYSILSVCTIGIFTLIVLCLTTDFNLLNGDKTPMTYKRANEFCSNTNENLLYPKNEYFETIFLRGIMYSPARNCDFVFLGWVADRGTRYISADCSRKTWSSLNIDKHVGLPENVLLYRIDLSNNSVLATSTYTQQDSLQGKSLLFLSDLPDEKLCHKHRYKCVYRFEPELPGEELMKSYQKAITGPNKLYAVVPFERNVVPENFNVTNTSSDDGVLVVAVRYNFDYYYQDVKMDYQSHRFVIVDPEYDCLAYDLRRDKLVTRHCEDLACPVCL